MSTVEKLIVLSITLKSAKLVVNIIIICHTRIESFNKIFQILKIEQKYQFSLARLGLSYIHLTSSQSSSIKHMRAYKWIPKNVLQATNQTGCSGLHFIFFSHTKPVNLYIVILRVKQSSYFKILPKDKQFSALGGFPLTAVGFTSI